MSQDMIRYEGNKYLARKAIFAFLGQKFHIYDHQGNLSFFVQQKAFKLKEAITVYADESKQTPLLYIKARSIMDFSGTYDVTTTSGENIGALKREGLRSMLQDEWTILDPSGRPIGKVMEDSTIMAILRRFLNNLIPQTFMLTIGDQHVATFDQHFNPFVAKFDLDFSPDPHEQLDRRLGIAAAVMLLAIEGRQQ